MEDGNNYKDINRGLRKVGIAIPEGPFLPLYILVVHSLNVDVGENWLGLVGDDNDSDNDANNEAKTRRGCQLSGGSHYTNGEWRQMRHQRG
jgi:hypothetical protein